MEQTKGYVHSLESFGSADGPGVRYIIFYRAAACGAGIAIIRIRGICKRELYILPKN